MSRALFVATATAVALLIPGSARAAGAEQGGSQIADCLGLTCVAPGSPNDVPQARGWVATVRGPGQLVRQKTAGFYEYGQGTTVGKRAVAYVVPYGQAGSMPASVRDLPEVTALEEEGPVGAFELGTVVIFGADASLFVPEDGAEARKAARRDIDAYNCYSQRFCLYGCWNWDQAGPCGGRLQFGASYAGQGWFNLGDVGRNDWVYSMRNRRDNDSLLARDNNGNGTKWCGQQHSVDSNLADEPIGSQSASSFRLTQIPNHC